MTVAGLLTGLFALSPDAYKLFIPYGIVLIIICGLGYIVAEWRERCEDRYKTVLHSYFEKAKTSYGDQMHLLIACGFYDLRTERELDRVCREIEKRRSEHPFGRWGKVIPKGQRLEALKCIHDNGLDMFRAAPVWPFFEDDPNNALAKLIPQGSNPNK